MNFKFLIPAMLSFAACYAAMPGNDVRFDQSIPENIVINNRILLKINGKPITVMDVVKKMDMLFYRQYPEMAESNTARFQFYSAAWRTILGSVVDEALIEADAKEKKIEITDGEVREELERLFGPDVVLNLDKAGMSLEEAFEILKTELIVQRMNMIMVRSKAMTEVPPMRVKERYEQMLRDQPPQNTWVYQVLSVRGEDHEKVAQEAFRLISEQKVPFENVISQLQSETATLSLSEEYSREERSLALAHKAILQTLSAGACSSPITKDDVTRLFCLKSFETARPALFNDLADKLKSELVQEASARLNRTYREKLRDYYGLTEDYLNAMVPDDLEPFALR